ncbi:MAG TPA: 50S ribosomal protein L6 [Saprospiraceae bacterium]|nr:50S ribosomal protein L6 [Saprospiraceae bacterium]HNT21194.1 50S ribosomal protein L6 [Saprospiraceae bacterium]
MSRIGKLPISLPKGVEVKIDKNRVTVKGPKGSLVQEVDYDMKVTVEDGTLVVSRPSDQKRHKALHGTTRAILANIIKGVSEGFNQDMEIVGVGYRTSNTGNLLEIGVGHSHPIMFYVPDELKVETLTEKGKAPLIKLSGTDRQLLGQISAKLRTFRKPEPYKGKGIKYAGEILRRKAGKAAGKAK